jgi:hypothetical protein
MKLTLNRAILNWLISKLKLLIDFCSVLMHFACMTQLVRSTQRAKVPSSKSAFFLPFLPFIAILILFLQAFSTVLDRALSGGYPNITADDIRAVVSEVILSGNPDFAALNNVLALAVNGNASLLSYDPPSFAQTYASLLPIACLDTREPFSLKNYSPEWFLTSHDETDIDDNSFAGLDKIRKRIAKDDTARMGNSGYLTLLVGFPKLSPLRNNASTSSFADSLRWMALPW